MAGGQIDVNQSSAVASYRDMRRGIGWLGLLLPVALVILDRGWRGSMSEYYYSGGRNWFVGSMCATGVFLIFYRYAKLDNVLSTVAGVLAIGVALFPTTPPVLHPALHDTVIGDFHLAFAAGFLLLLAYFCGFLFTKSAGPDAETRKKKQRNVIYRGCGAVIAAGVLTAGLFDALTSDSFRNAGHPIFWCETAAVWAFGFAWLIKGETLFQDSDDQVLPQPAE